MSDSYVAPAACHAESSVLQDAQPRLQRSSGTHAIVVAPTRELCLQIADVLGLVLRRYHHLVSPA